MKNLTGKRFGRLTVVDKTNERRRHCVVWLCKCDCGNTKKVVSADLLNGDTRSCGCLHSEIFKSIRSNEKFLADENGRYKHGGKGTRLYTIWKCMKKRCINPHDKSFPCYGGRGIKVCDEWAHDFKVFHDWAIENGYRDDLTIDRIDIDGDYTPGNCRWATNEIQANNKRNNVKIEYNGELHTIPEWAQITGISKSVLRGRYRNGWEPERMLNQKVRRSPTKNKNTFQDEAFPISKKGVIKNESKANPAEKNE